MFVSQTITDLVQTDANVTFSFSNVLLFQVNNSNFSKLLTECQRCPAPGQVCDPVTGECVCPPNTHGKVCERCTSNSWNYHPMRGCQLCQCDGVGAFDGNCEPLSGQCRCKPGYTGHKVRWFTQRYIRMKIELIWMGTGILQPIIINNVCDSFYCPIICVVWSVPRMGARTIRQFSYRRWTFVFIFMVTNRVVQTENKNP